MMGRLFIAALFISAYVEGYIVNPGPKYVATKGAVWPRPQAQNSSEEYFDFQPDNFAFVINGTDCNLLLNVLQRYLDIVAKDKIHTSNASSSLGALKILEVRLNGECNDSEYPNIDMDESYTLSVTSDEASLSATSIWGIMRGVESFSQLIYLADDKSGLRINSTIIRDFPRFKHRGLLLDTARHFIPLQQIYQIIDGMAFNKLNVFHWHLVDDQSFPFVSKTFPELSQQGAYDLQFVYTPAQVQEVIEYARHRGIRVMPEFDTPGHTRSWGNSHPELLTPCDVVQKGSLGPMDPTKDSTYDFFQKLLGEVRSVFKDQFVHLGGDEVEFDCWAADETITSFMKERNMTSYSDLEGYYIQKIIDMADALQFSPVVWEEVFKNGVKLPNETIVHIWRDWEGSWWNDTMNDVTKAGETALLSACWYLDYLSSGGDWWEFYKCEPTDFGGSAEQIELVLGGEACMWGEVVNTYNVVQRIWPRASAPAEKLWSSYVSKEDFNYEETAKRLEEHTCRMNKRGIPAQPPNAAGFCL